MKKVFVTGNVGKTPERSANLGSGESFTTFSLAVTSGFKDNIKTDWFEISCKGKLGKFALQYIQK